MGSFRVLIGKLSGRGRSLWSQKYVGKCMKSTLGGNRGSTGVSGVECRASFCKALLICGVVSQSLLLPHTTTQKAKLILVFAKVSPVTLVCEVMEMLHESA